MRPSGCNSGETGKESQGLESDQAEDTGVKTISEIVEIKTVAYSKVINCSYRYHLHDYHLHLLLRCSMVAPQNQS